MRESQEAYDRLMQAQRERPDASTIAAWEAERRRDETNRMIRRRLPKVI